MRQRKSQPDTPDDAKRRRTSSDSLHEDSHPETSENESKQPYASEVNDYRGGKTKPPKESPTTADG